MDAEVKRPKRADPEGRTHIAMTYRPTTELHERLRTVSFHSRRPMQDLIDEAVKWWLDTKVS